MAEETKELRPRAVFMAFGTKGDVFPIASLAAAFSCDQSHYQVTMISHSDHQGLSEHLEAKNVTFVPISSPPVLPAYHDDSKHVSFSLRKEMIQTTQRNECLSAVASIFGDDPCQDGDFIVINFFALEGWSLAELYNIKCVVAAPYVVPYSAPSTFERFFKKELPYLYKYFLEAPFNMICWKDVVHWMWPLFTETWVSWRNDLNLSHFPCTDPVTNLPMWHMRAQSPLVLYGFSKEIVEHPGYWPRNVRVCGFWFVPMEWQFSCRDCLGLFSASSSMCPADKNELCSSHANLQRFLEKSSSRSSIIFVGLSSVGSMGFLKNNRAFLKVLETVLEITDLKFILLTAGYGPLDASIKSIATALENSDCGDSIVLFNERLFCFSGSIPYSWLFPKCDVVIHHGGSGSTAAALHAGIPQVLCPFILDQFYWAERLFWIGVAPAPLQSKQILPEDGDDVGSIMPAADALSKAISLALSPEMKAQAANIANRIAQEDGVGEALRILKEEMHFLGRKHL